MPILAAPASSLVARVLPFTALAALAVGCSVASSDATDESADEWKVKPKDVDPLTQATLDLTIPSGPDMANVSKRLVNVTGPGFSRTATYGTPFVARAGAWKVCFIKTTYGGSFPPYMTVDTVTKECTSLTTAPGDHTSLALGAVRVAVKTPTLPAAAAAPAFGPVAQAPRYAHDGAYVDESYVAYSGGAVVFAGDHAVKMTAAVSTVPDFLKTVTVAPGAIVNVTPSTTVLGQPGAMKAKITFEAAELPTPSSWGLFEVVGDLNDDTSADWSPTTFKRALFSRPNDGASDLSLAASTCPGCSAVLRPVTGIGGTRFAADVPMKGDVTIALKRIDVDDVDVTPLDGGPVYTVRGKWTVQRTGTNDVAGPFDTHLGIDVPSGGYDVVITYDTHEKAKQTQKFHADL